VNTFAIMQAVIIALVVLASAVVAFRKLLPKTATRAQARLAAALNRPTRPAWMRALSRSLQPATATGSCGDGCGSCGSCGPAPQADVQPLHFKQRLPK
jgi:hypothetical protein